MSGDFLPFYFWHTFYLYRVKGLTGGLSCSFLHVKSLIMLKKINSDKDIRQLVIGDTLIDDTEISRAKKYTVRNIADGIIYAIYDNGYCDLKVFSADLPSHTDWWLLMK